jgi:hypothetical protein
LLFISFLSFVNVCFMCFGCSIIGYIYTYNCYILLMNWFLYHHIATFLIFCDRILMKV